MPFQLEGSDLPVAFADLEQTQLRCYDANVRRVAAAISASQ